MAATNEGSEYYLQGNIIKYIWRYRYKNGVEDLEKALFYLKKLIETKRMTRVKIFYSKSRSRRVHDTIRWRCRAAEIEDYVKDIIHEVDGLKMTSLRIVTEET